MTEHHCCCETAGKLPLLVKVVNKSTNPCPEYATPYSAGVDLRAFIPSDITLAPLERKIIPTGLYIELPIGFEAQLRPRSGMAIKHGITLINCVGTIDADYRGEIGIPIVNLSSEPYTIHNGDRIAQMVISSHETVDFVQSDNLSETERGEGGFGHTGNA